MGPRNIVVKETAMKSRGESFNSNELVELSINSQN